MTVDGERDRQLRETEKARAGYVKEIDDIGRAYKRREVKLLAEKKKLENPGNLKNLRVIWEQNGEEQMIGPLEEATPVEFLRAVDAIPRSIRAKLDGGRMSRLETIRGELNQIPREYKQKRRTLETRIYHCDERIAKLKEGATP